MEHDNWPNEEEAAAADLEAAQPLTPEQEEMLSGLLEGPSFDELVTAGIQELFERIITLENVLADTLTILIDTSESFAARTRLQELLVPAETEKKPEWDSESGFGPNPGERGDILS